MRVAHRLLHRQHSPGYLNAIGTKARQKRVEFERSLQRGSAATGSIACRVILHPAKALTLWPKNSTTALVTESLQPGDLSTLANLSTLKGSCNRRPQNRRKTAPPCGSPPPPTQKVRKPGSASDASHLMSAFSRPAWRCLSPTGLSCRLIRSKAAAAARAMRVRAN